jgi:hypothetical protein
MEFDVLDRIVAFKRSMAPWREALKRAYADVTDHVRRAVESTAMDFEVDFAARATEKDLTDLGRAQMDF